ncbi:protein SRC2-like [Cornus florida]|uniref:protein SRC2-like n=1 Tax=Cornus florida TaxID=4283 RepID=UPI0028A1F378|nr:protein SRC2-like [Cornus florida]
MYKVRSIDPILEKSSHTQSIYIIVFSVPQYIYISIIVYPSNLGSSINCLILILQSDMEYRSIDITIISAEGLNDVNLVSKMDVYVVASISGVRKMTPVDKRGGTFPKWNHRMQFSVAESAVNKPHLCLLFQIRSDRVLGDKDIGYVSVPLRDLLAGGYTDTERIVEYQVQKPSGRPKGTLKFSFKFDGNITHPSTAAPAKVHEPVTAYPPYVDPSKAGAAAPEKVHEYVTAYPPYVDPSKAGTAMAYPPYGGASTAGAAVPVKGQEPVQAFPPNMGSNTTGAPPPAGVAMAYNPPPAYAYPPHTAGYGYPPPPQAYPAPPMAGGYGYAQPQVQKPKKKKNNFGMGLGAGLLGGLLVGDMLSDAGDMGSYDGGFDDAGFDGGFDF